MGAGSSRPLQPESDGTERQQVQAYCQAPLPHVSGLRLMKPHKRRGRAAKERRQRQAQLSAEQRRELLAAEFERLGIYDGNIRPFPKGHPFHEATLESGVDF